MQRHAEVLWLSFSLRFFIWEIFFPASFPRATILESSLIPKSRGGWWHDVNFHPITGFAPSAVSWVTVKCNLSLAILKRANLQGKLPWLLMRLLSCLLPILTAQGSSYREMIICRVPDTVGSERLLQYNERVIMIKFTLQ